MQPVSLTIKIVEVDGKYSLSLVYDGAQLGLYGWYEDSGTAHRVMDGMFAVVKAALFTATVD